MSTDNWVIVCARNNHFIVIRCWTLVFVRTADVTLVNKETAILLLGLQLFCATLLQFCPTLCNPIDWTHQAPLSMGFSRLEYWSGLPCPPPGDLLDLGIFLTQGSNPCLLSLLHWQVDSLPPSYLGNPFTFRLNMELQLQKPKLCGFHISYSVFRSWVAKNIGMVGWKDWDSCNAAVWYSVKSPVITWVTQRREKLLGKVEGRGQNGNVY